VLGVKVQRYEKCSRCGQELKFSPIVNELKCPSCDSGTFFEIEINEKFVKQNLEKIVLSLLEQQPLSGYDIIKAIFQRFDIPVSHGRVYPLLYSLEGRGVLKGAIEGGAKVKKVYSLTPQGIDILKSKSEEFATVKKHLGLASPPP
jgi:DNA-binding PadR family transcriptional regulator/DNA-directed RNA polymerase subunit RPC12/RpoP